MMPHECQGWDCPEFAAAVSDAEELVRCAASDDSLGTRVICDALAQDGSRASDVAAYLAGMCARMLRCMPPG